MSFCQKFIGVVVKTANFGSIVTFWCQFFLESFWILLSFSDIEQKISFVKFLCLGCDNLNQCVKRSFFTDNFFSKRKNQLFCQFRNFTDSFSTLCRKVIGDVVKTALYVSKETFEEDYFLRKTTVFYQFWTLSDFCRPHSDNFLAWLSKLQSICP